MDKFNKTESIFGMYLVLSLLFVSSYLARCRKKFCKRNDNLLDSAFLIRKFDKQNIDAWDVTLLVALLERFRLSRPQHAALRAIRAVRNELSHPTDAGLPLAQFQAMQKSCKPTKAKKLFDSDYSDFNICCCSENGCLW